jgi:hypothetical protein
MAAAAGPGLTGDAASVGGQHVGYARVSTRGQDLSMQLEAPEHAGGVRVFQDVGSGTIRRRPQLDACLDYYAPATRWWCGGSTDWVAASGT